MRLRADAAARHAAVAQGAGGPRPGRQRRHRRRADLCASDPRWRPTRNEELYSTDNRSTADGLAGLPRDYSGVPAAGSAAARRPRPPDPRRPEPRPARAAARRGRRPTPVSAPEEQRRASGDRDGPHQRGCSPRTETRAAERRKRRRQYAGASRLPDLDEPWPSAAAGDANCPGSPATPSSTPPPIGAQSSADRVAAPASPNILQAGAVISAALITGIRSDLPGPDHRSGDREYLRQPDRPHPSRTAGHARHRPVRQQRAVRPKPRPARLEPAGSFRTAGRSCSSASRAPTPKAMPALQDGVDYHWWDLAKAAGLSTLLSVGAELATNDDDRLIQAIRNGGQDTINDAGQQIVRRQLNIAPTLTIRPGFPVRVIVTRDLVLEPYGG